jgi:hypothetical protein
MYASIDHKRRTERLVHEKDLFVCHTDCNSENFVIYGAFWPLKMTPRMLEVQSNCAECDAGASIELSVEDAKRCGFSDPDEDL